MSHCIHHLLQNLTEKRPWVDRYVKTHGQQRLTLFRDPPSPSTDLGAVQAQEQSKKYLSGLT